MKKEERKSTDSYVDESGFTVKAFGGGNLEDEELESEELEEEVEEETSEDDELESEEEELGEEEESEEEEKEFDVATVKNLLDPGEYPEELQPALKKMQGALTKQMQGNKEKIQLAELMESNPVELAKLLAQKAGLTLAEEKEEKVDESELSETEKWLNQLIEKKLGGVKTETNKELAQMKAIQSISYLDETYPDWTLYETEMNAIAQKHPTLAQDLDTLYDLAKKTESSAEGIISRSAKKKKVATKTSTKRSEKAPTRPKTLKEAMALAAKKLNL